MRSCTCYEDLDAKKRNTELNDSYLASNSPALRYDYSWRNQENDSYANAQSIDLGNSNGWEPKRDAIRSRSTSTLPNASMDAMDEVQTTLQRLKQLREQGLIDEDE